MKQKQGIINRLSGGGSIPWQFKSFLALKKLFSIIMFMMFAVPSFADSWDWNDNYTWKNSKYNGSTHTWTWSIKVYDEEDADEGFVRGNKLEIYVSRSGGADILIGHASSGEYGKDQKFEPTAAGTKLGFSGKAGSRDWVDMTWKMPMSYLSKPVKMHFKGKWTAWTSKNTKSIDVTQDVTKTHRYVLWIPMIKKDEKPKFVVDKVENHKVTQWHYVIPFDMERVADPENPAYVDELATINANIAQKLPDGSTKYYRRDTIGVSLLTHCKVNKATDKTKYSVERKSTEGFNLYIDSIYDKAGETKPKLLRYGMSLLLRSTYWHREKAKEPAEIFHSVPEATNYNYEIPAAPYPESLTATFVREKDNTGDTVRYVRLSWTASSKSVSGRWKIFSYPGKNETNLKKVSSNEPLITVPKRDTIFVYDIPIDAATLKNPQQTYVVAWEPESFTSSTKDDPLTYIEEISNKKTIDVSRYINITDAKCDSEEQYIKLTWTTTTNQTPKEWNGQCDIWTEKGKLKTIKPIEVKGSVRKYEFYHLSSISEMPAGVKEENVLRANLTQCSPHTYEIRASYDNASAQYTKTVFNNRAIDVGIGFRTADVSKGMYSDKVRISATTNNPDDVKLFYKVERKDYGDPIDYVSNELTLESPVGTIGMLKGREAIVVELNVGGVTKKIAVATMNVGATSVDDGAGTANSTCYGRYFTYQQAMNPDNSGLTDGWYVPSKAEMTALGALTNCNWNSTKVGYEWTFKDTQTTLFLPAAGYYNPGHKAASTNVFGRYADYWLSDKIGDKQGGNLFFSFETRFTLRNHDTDYEFTVRPFCALEHKALTIESPVGTIGSLNGREAIVVELNVNGEKKKVAVATMNVGATSVEGTGSYGSYYTYEEANNPTKTGLTDGWYVPSKEEIDALSDLSMSWNSTKKGYEWTFNNGASSLFIPAAGWIDPGKKTATYQGTYGDYWMSTQNSETHGWNLFFHSTNYQTRGFDATYKFTVRPFCALPAQGKGFQEMYTQNNGSATVSWEDYSAAPGKYYIYRIKAGYACEQNDTVMIHEDMVGFCQNTGIISGKITYNGGSAAQSIDLSLVPDDLDSNNKDRNMQHSMDLDTDGSVQWTVPDKNFASQINKSDYTIQFWVCPTLSDANDKGASLFKFGNLSLTRKADGLYLGSTALNVSLQQSLWNHITIAYSKKENIYKVLVYRPVSNGGEYQAVKADSLQNLIQDVIASSAIDVASGKVLSLGGAAGQYDDFRLYTRQLTMQELCDTYDRHLHGEEKDLQIYWTFNEGLPEYAFDTSRSGTQLNGRHGTVTNGRRDNYDNVFPNLGFRTRTDMYGNYVLRGIPFDGELGVSYLLNPDFPDHSFQPANRQHIVSGGSLVFNGSNFEDVSSFPFYGNVTYLYGDIPADSVEVRIDGMQQADANGTLVTDRNGNFRVDVPIGEHYITLQRKGHAVNCRWPEDPDGQGIKHNFISTEGLGTEAAPIHFTDSTMTLIAGRVVGGDIEAERPLGFGKSKANIGRGTIVLKLASVGGYNLNTSSNPIDVAYREFDDSLKLNTECDAQILPPTDKELSKVRIRTNPLTGEFYAKLPPVAFTVDSVFTKDFVSYGLKEDFGSTARYAFTPVPTDTIVDTLRYIKPVETSDAVQTETALKADTTINTFEYGRRLNFVRHNTPTYDFFDATTRRNIHIDSLMYKDIPEDIDKLYFGDVYYDVAQKNLVGLLKKTTNKALNPQNTDDMSQLYELGYPVYRDSIHRFDLYAYEIYYNNDNADAKVDSVPLVGRNISVQNGLGAISYNSDGVTPQIPIERVTLDEYGYCKFYCIPGLPNLAPPYLLNIALTDCVTGDEFFNIPVYVFGDKKIEGSSFVTEGPQEVQYVIHDPYGTNSSAWLEKGSTYSHTTSTTTMSNYSYLSQYYGLTGKIKISDFGFDSDTQQLDAENNPLFIHAGTKQSTTHETTMLNGEEVRNKELYYDSWTIPFFISANIEASVDSKKIWSNGQETKIVTTNTERISTSDSPDYVGPPADVFVGESRNIIISDTKKLGLFALDDSILSNSGKTNILDRKSVCIDIRDAIGFSFSDTTQFRYTRYHIENELIPELKRLRRNIFFDKPDTLSYGRYILKPGIDIDNVKFDWDAEKDSIYTWIEPQNGNGENRVQTYTSHIQLWEDQLAADELMQAKYHQSVVIQPDNRSLNTGVTYSKTVSGKVAHTSTETYQHSMKNEVNFGLELGLSGKTKGGQKLEIKFNMKLSQADGTSDDTFNYDSLKVTTDTYSSNLSWGYQLKETVAGNYTSQDIYTTESNTVITQNDSVWTLMEGSPIFILRGGQTRSPWEKALRMKYFDMHDPGNPENIIGSDTQPLCNPVLRFPNEIYDHAAEYLHLRAGHPVNIPLQLNSLSANPKLGVDYILTAYANGDATALNMKVDGASIVGASRLYRLKTDQPITTSLIVSQARPDKYDYDTWIYLLANGQSAYDSPMGYIADSVRLKLHFDPTSSDVSITPGASVLNLDSKGNLQLRVDDYDRNLDNFCCIDLMYRRPDEGEFNHTFARYWVNEDMMKAYGSNNTIPVLGKEFQQAVLLPEEPRFVHDFDMSQMYDGEYYITAVARSYYPDGAGGTTAAFAAEYQCEPVLVKKDMTAPQVLGRPTPEGGYLTLRDQAVATFTEDINTNRLVKYRHINAYLKEGEKLTPIDLDFSADERHIYIDLEPVRHLVHGKYVRYVLKGVEDMAGNVMADSVAWDTYVDLSTLDWEHEVVNLTASVSELATLSFTPVLINNTGREQQFILCDTPDHSNGYMLPSLLTTGARRGIVPALSTMPVEFRIAGSPEIGHHKAVVYVVADDDDAICTALEVNLTVVGDAPSIGVDEANYSDNMTLIANVNVPEGAFVYPDRDLLYAFVGNSCVGKANLKRGSDGKHIVFMDIYGSRDMSIDNPPVSFMAWDASTNTLYPTVTPDDNQAITYDKDKIVGTVGEPKQLTVHDDTQMGIELAKGWTWASFNVNVNASFPEFLTPITESNSTFFVKNATDAVKYDKNMGDDPFVGGLKTQTPDPAQMYAFNLQQESLFRVVGKPVDPAQCSITLAPYGWTWMGYTPQGYNNVNAALANLKATEGDIIKSQEAFSVFYKNAAGDGAWYGNLEVLTPGHGYKYHSNSSEPVAFTYAPSKTNARSKARRQEAAGTHWNVDTYYADNMTVLGRVFADDEPLTHGEIGCFVGTECRGRVRIDSNGYAFIVVQGAKTGESIQCYYWDDETETEHVIAPMLSYTTDSNLGSFDNPVRFVLDDASGITEVEDADGDYEYYNLQGLRVDRRLLQRGSIYIRTNGVSTDKILKK